MINNSICDASLVIFAPNLAIHLLEFDQNSMQTWLWLISIDFWCTCTVIQMTSEMVEKLALGVVAEWSKLLTAVPWLFMVWSTLALGTYQLRFVSSVFHVIFSFVHFISLYTLGDLCAFRKPLPDNMYLFNLWIANHILIKIKVQNDIFPIPIYGFNIYFSIRGWGYWRGALLEGKRYLCYYYCWPLPVCVRSLYPLFIHAEENWHHKHSLLS